MASSAPFELVVPARGAKLRVVGHPVADPRGGVVIAHGFAEHAGRWSRFQVDLAARGYASFVAETRGHGGSSGARGHTPSWAALGEDLTAVVDALEAERRLPARRALLGASMGGLVVAAWAPAHAGRFHGYVLCSPYLAPARRLPAHKVALARIVSGVWPGLAQAHGLRGRELSHDATVVDAYDHDPRLVRVMSAGWFTQMRAAQARVAAAVAAGPDGPGKIADAPVLLLHGADDPIADPKAAEAFMALAQVPGSERRLYPGMLHEPLNELERNRVLADLARWLDRNILGTNRIGA